MNLTDNRRVFLSNVSHQTPNDGYDLPFADGDLMSAFYVGLVNFILMLCSSAAGIMTIIFSFKYNSDSFLKWRYVDRLIVYKAMKDVVYYSIGISYTIQVTVENDNYPSPLSCTMYALLSNIFGLSQALMSVAIAIMAFVLVNYNKQLSMGPGECFLVVFVLFFSTILFIIVGAAGQLGPNGFYCNFDGVKGQISHLVIVSVGFTLLITFTTILYVLICFKMYKKSKIVGLVSLAKKRTLIIAKHSSLLILAFLLQFGAYILDGIWRANDIPPKSVHFIFSIIGSAGGIINGLTFRVVMKQNKKSVLPVITTTASHQSNEQISSSKTWKPVINVGQLSSSNSGTIIVIPH